MYPVVRLGDRGNGATRLPAIDLDKFVILVTAERDGDISEPSGRIVLRGESPSTRLQPPDLMRFAIGAAAPKGEHTHHEPELMPNDSTAWPMVPMPAHLTMLPGEMALRPDVLPYLPRAGRSHPAPAARPYEVASLHDGDTLRLTAGVVSRTINGRRLACTASMASIRAR